jgi:siroheme synthase
LIDRGWPAGTPAAIVADATRADQQTWRGTIEALAADTVAIAGDGPASIVIGAVAALDLTDVNLADLASGFGRTVKEQRNATN